MFCCTFQCFGFITPLFSLMFLNCILKINVFTRLHLPLLILYGMPNANESPSMYLMIWSYLLCRLWGRLAIRISSIGALQSIVAYLEANLACSTCKISNTKAFKCVKFLMIVNCIYVGAYSQFDLDYIETIKCWTMLQYNNPYLEPKINPIEWPWPLNLCSWIDLDWLEISLNWANNCDEKMNQEANFDLERAF